MMPDHQPTEAIVAIRSVRIAAHELSNACAAVVGGTALAISLATVDTIGEPVRARVTLEPVPADGAEELPLTDEERVLIGLAPLMPLREDNA